MRSHLLCLVFIAALSAHYVPSYGQDSSPSDSTRKIPEPLYILNTNIIANGLIPHLDSKKVKGILVYKGKDGPGVLKNITSTGIISITYDDQVVSKSFAELGVQYGLRNPFSFIINGHKLDAAQLAFLRIAPEAIGKLDITPATPGNPETIVSIQLTKNKVDNRNKAPGTIMIR